MTNLQIQNIKIADILAYKNNPKLHNRAQVAKIRESIREFGFINPILLDENLEIIAGHGRVAAAQDAGMHDIPAIILSHLTDAQKRAYRIADNKLTELGKWSVELLNLEFSELSNLDLDFNLEITGFETAEIDLILDGDGASDPKTDAIPALLKSLPLTLLASSRLTTHHKSVHYTHYHVTRMPNTPSPNSLRQSYDLLVRALQEL